MSCNENQGCKPRSSIEFERHELIPYNQALCTKIIDGLLEQLSKGDSLIIMTENASAGLYLDYNKNRVILDEFFDLLKDQNK